MLNMRDYPLQHALLAIAFILLAPAASQACTSFLITRGASADGSTMITYAADSHDLYGELYYRPPGTYPPGTLVDVIEWDTNKKIGQIKQAAQTFLVVGNMNEHQVAISETTFEGRKELINGKQGVDYGSLIYFALQRAKTAREAIKVMGQLVEEYGYRSSGESFSISDAKEVWILEMVGKGPRRKGALWVARKIPDGYISAHANQARIRQFPLQDPESCLYAPDVISFAREKGYFSGRDEEFSFADTYAPLNYEALRFCEARVWQMFRRAAPRAKLSLDYVKGVEGATPLPLWIKPDRKLTVRDVMALMRDHFEETPFDLTRGIGAGPYNLPYRWRPLTWKVDGVEYVNDRATSTQQTGFSFVSQSRAWLPDPIGGVLWFGVDDTASTVYMPMYCSIKEVPESLAVGTATFTRFSWKSAFWVFNMVSNFAYLRYRDMIKDIQAIQQRLEQQFMKNQSTVERTALGIYRKDPDRAQDYLTRYSVNQAQKTTTRWRTLSEELLLKYLDGNVRNAKGKAKHPGYPEAWYRRIVQEDGELYKKRQIKGESKPAAEQPKKKKKNKPPTKAAVKKGG